MSYPQYRRRPQRVVTGGLGFGPTLVVFLLVIGGAVWLANRANFIDLSALASGPGISAGGGQGQGQGGGKDAKPSSDAEKILAEALKYDDKPYIWGAGHPPDEPIAKRGVDCSGLVAVAVMNATGIKDDHLAEGFRRSKYWKHLGDPKKPKTGIPFARKGDILYDLRDPGDSTDHVVFVVDNPGDGKMVVFEARTSNDALKEQIRHSYNQKYSRFDGALRFQR